MGSVGGAGLLLVCFACKAAQGTPHLVIVPSSCTMLLWMHAVQACFVIRVCGGRDDGVGEGCALLGAWCEVVNMVTFWARVWHAPPPPIPPPPTLMPCFPLLLSTQSKKILVVLTNVSQMGDHADKKVCAPVPTYQLAPQRRMRLCDVCVTNRRFARCSLW